MEDLIKQEIEVLKNDSPRLKKYTDEHLFSFVCYKYFYREGKFESSEPKFIHTDGPDDGGIDLIYKDESFEGPFALLIQTKYVHELKNKNDVLNMVNQIVDTVHNFRKNKTEIYNKQLRKLLTEAMDEVGETNKLTINIFVNAEVSADRKKEITEMLKEKEEFEVFEPEIYFNDDINSKIQNVKTPVASVPEAKISWDKKAGALHYGENGVVINVSANSIKRLYAKYGLNGLFEQNFRYFVKQKQIDEKISDSINRKKDQFWFFNNGIIIGCSDFRADGHEYVLYDFSIINGAQTSTIIGESKVNEDFDFWITCKLIKSQSAENRDDFIADIAEASNSQKPISLRDLKSTKIEQRLLREKLAENNPPIYLEIKRGQKKPPRTAEEWQVVKNEYLGQLVTAFHFQMPGTARAQKKKIFSDNGLYYRIFQSEKLENKSYEDLLKLSYEVDDLCQKLLEEESFTSDEQADVAKNGFFVILALIGFAIKEKRKMIEVKSVREKLKWTEQLTKEKVGNGLFAAQQEDFRKDLKDLIKRIIRILAYCFDKQKRDEEISSVTNLFKTDSYYQSRILPYFIDEIYQEDGKLAEFQKLLKIFI